MKQSSVGHIVSLMRGVRLRKVYVLTLLTLTTLTWTCIMAAFLTLGVLSPHEITLHCKVASNGSTPSVACVTAATAPYLQIRGVSRMTARVTASLGNTLINATKESVPDKVILRWTKFYGKPWVVPTGRKVFEDLECPERRCILVDNHTLLPRSDAVLVHMRDVSSTMDLPKFRLPNQRWIFYLLESPYHTQLNLTQFNGYFNWTSTYSYESDIPSPYGVYTHNRSRWGLAIGPTIPADKLFQSKTRLAAWFVTNCKARNQREDYVAAMQNHMMVDVYGNCGRLKCRERDLCRDMLRRKYKFYVAFENSNCRQYITEKFWHTALENNIVPVVMGAPKEDYERVAPPHSFIHVDDFPSARELSRYLRMLHKDTRLYNEYFRWKRNGYARTQINMNPLKSQFWCNLCSALHNKSLPVKTHWDLAQWWSVDRQCS